MRGRIYEFSSLIMIIIIQLMVNPTYIVTAEPQSIIQLSNPPIVDGYVHGDFGENGCTTFGFHGYFPSKWNSTAPILLESRYNFFDNTVNRNVYYRLDFEVSFFNEDDELIYHDIKVVFTYKNTGYEFFDRFDDSTEWNLTSTITGISDGELWEGIVYLTGTVTLGSQTYSNSSTTWNITYSTNHNISVSTSGFSNWIIISGVLFVIILFKRQSFKREDKPLGKKLPSIRVYPR